MDAGILDARVNLFSNPFAQFIYVGNGPIEGDPIYIDGEPFGDGFLDGWRSIDPDVHFHWPMGENPPTCSFPQARSQSFPA
jgi:hypothetical protein